MMKRSLSLLAIMLALVITLTAFPHTASAAPSYAKGDKIQDFTFSTYDGQTIALSDILKEKEAVLINIWATWCGPCRNEFPHLQEAYAKYQDRVEVIALSCEPTDTPDVLAAFAEQYQLTFKIGQDTVGFLSALGVTSIPTTLMIDRFGTICYVASGSVPDAASFTRLFDAFLGEDYTQSVLLDGIPPKQPDVAPSSERDLAEALNADGENIAFHNPASKSIWPMVVTEKDGRSVVASSNQGVNSSESAVSATISAKANDTVVVTFKVSSETIFDVLQLRINDKVVKSFAGEEDWQTFAYAIPTDNNYEVEIAYVKNAQTSSGEDTLWIDSIAVVSGNEAEKAIANNPSYPCASEIDIDVLNERAREIVISDPTGNIAIRYADSVFYFIPDEEVQFSFDMVSEYDPETAIVYFNYDGTTYALSDCLAAGQYVASSGGDSIKTTGYCDSSVILYPDLNTSGKILTYFKTEADIDAFLSALTSDANGNPLATWTYADASAHVPVHSTEDAEAAAEVEYTLICIDQDGNPVEGAMLQVCNAETCQVLNSDENGECTFTAAPYAWEIHVLKAPTGYTAESTYTVLAPVYGGKMVFSFIKN